MGITSIRLTDDLDIPLESLTKKLDRSKNYFIKQALKECLASNLSKNPDGKTRWRRWNPSKLANRSTKRTLTPGLAAGVPETELQLLKYEGKILARDRLMISNG